MYSTAIATGALLLSGLAHASPLRKRLDIGVKDPMGNTSLAPFPTYAAVTDFDIASFTVALYQEYIELDLFQYGYNLFSEADFAEAGLSSGDRFLLQFMASQETGHAALISNILAPSGYTSKACTYNYTTAFNTSDIRSYFEFNEKLTRWGESGVIGFLAHLNSRDSANLLHASISTESRQQMIFRQYLGASAMPVWFEPGIPQAWAWTLLAPYIESCPAENTKVAFSNFPSLTVTNNPTLQRAGSQGAISTNITALSAPGETLNFMFDSPGMAVGPNKTEKIYVTSNSGKPAAYALFVSQLNATMVPLMNVTKDSASVKIPAGNVFYHDPAINGSSFVALVDKDAPFVTAYNLSMINPHMVAGPAVLQSG